jgi:hypothetical protein
MPGFPEQVELVGKVDAGIKAAEWSPDEELLILITGACGCFRTRALVSAKRLIPFFYRQRYAA